MDEYDTKIELLARRFSALLGEILRPEQREAILEENVSLPPGGPCASHDYTDANVPMEAAFEEVFGEPVDPMRWEHSRRWRKAWTMAIKNRFYWDQEL